MATVTMVTDKKGTITLFASEELAKRSIEFSCHRLEGKVEYTDEWDDDGFHILANCPNGDKITIEEVGVHDRVTHL